MHDDYQALWQKQDDGKTCWDSLPPSEKLPPLRYFDTDADGWEDIELPVLYFYGGLIPYVSRCVFFVLFIVNASFPGPHLTSEASFNGHCRYRTTA